MEKGERESKLARTFSLEDMQRVIKRAKHKAYARNRHQKEVEEQAHHKVAKEAVLAKIKAEQGENDRLRRNAAVLQLQQIRLACDKNTIEQIVGERELHAQALLWRLFEAIEQYNDSAQGSPEARAQQLLEELQGAVEQHVRARRAAALVTSSSEPPSCTLRASSYPGDACAAQLDNLYMGSPSPVSIRANSWPESGSDRLSQASIPGLGTSQRPPRSPSSATPRLPRSPFSTAGVNFGYAPAASNGRPPINNNKNNLARQRQPVARSRHDISAARSCGALPDTMAFQSEFRYLEDLPQQALSMGPHSSAAWWPPLPAEKDDLGSLSWGIRSHSWG